VYAVAQKVLPINRFQVMLRNIPNKVDQATLKEYVDETSRGLYNFLYLRIGTSPEPTVMIFL
jgi:hypothetical protein